MNTLEPGQSDEILERKVEDASGTNEKFSIEELLENPDQIIDSLKIESSVLRK